MVMERSGGFAAATSPGCAAWSAARAPPGTHNMAPASARLLTLAITASALPYSLSAHQACLDRPVDQWLFRGNEKDTRAAGGDHADADRSEEHTSELPSLMRNSYAVFC